MDKRTAYKKLKSKLEIQSALHKVVIVKHNGKGFDSDQGASLRLIMEKLVHTALEKTDDKLGVKNVVT